MKAMVIEEFGGPEVFVERDVDTPEPAEGQVRIKVVASSVNPLETKIRSGLVKTGPAMPAILNGDVSGVVDKVGPGVSGFAVGDEVFGCAGGVKGWQGALADYMIADVRLLGKRTPAMALPLAECAALPLVFLTAWSALVDRAQLQPGEQVLIHAGIGGVGHVAIQIAKYLGARVATTVSTEEKAAQARALGADDIIFYRDESVEDYKQRLTGGNGFSLVFDTVGGENLDRSIEATAINGRLCSINTRSTHDLSQMHAKSLTLHVIFRSISLLYGVGMNDQPRLLKALCDLLEQGRVRPLLDSQRFRFSQVGDAHRRLESGQAVGKILLER
ncbi:zinc-dependent alcohol dehydrogenase family protein [Marinobacter arenosus]|uniref:zinc-dependent alcohol dehydrogenase family protein n=1 Tax=Marinobacter arenosus TaxID=2856822 RepID=UPI001C4D7B3D|nr:zinc-dependent alcohol dehydrogenase family protein [Marinobacter arenosus]MBW0146647.1 zinc-dependent alcohol dehydrogenase family protein [Marinobacter arenosus]